MKTMTLKNRSFILIVIGQVISMFGTGILRFALPLYLLQQSGSSALFGAVGALAFLPLIVLMPFGGIIADRASKRNIMVALDCLAGFLMLGFHFAFGKLSLIPLLIVTLMLLYGVNGLYQPAVSASVPLLLEGAALAKGNGIVSSVSALSNLLSPFIGGVLLARFGLSPIVFLSFLCFFSSALLELFIRLPQRPKAARAPLLASAKSDFRLGLRFITKQKPALFRVVVVAFLLNTFVSALLMIAMPVLLTERMGLSKELYGLSQGIFACGGLLGGLVAGLLAGKIGIRHLGRCLVLLFLCKLPFALSTLLLHAPTLSFILLCGSAFLLMAVATLISVNILSFVQQETPCDLQGKVISLLMTLSLCAQPLGQLINGFAFERLIGYDCAVVVSSALLLLPLARFARRVAS